MRTAGKVLIGLLVFAGLCLLLNRILTPFFDWVHPVPEKILSRMEQQDAEAAQEIVDNYSEGLKLVSAATNNLEESDSYYYALNINASWNREALDEMPQELVDALRQMERKYPECEESLEFHKGQIGVWLTDDGGGFSILCYPGGELISSSMIDNERGTRCLDLGDGWELQMYYAPKG